jgi:hypothetical protein
MSGTKSPSSPHLCCLLVAFLDVQRPASRVPAPASAHQSRPGTLWVVPLNATRYDRERSCCAPRLQGGVKERNELRFIPIREAPRLQGGELHSYAGVASRLIPGSSLHKFNPSLTYSEYPCRTLEVTRIKEEQKCMRSISRGACCCSFSS